MEGRPSIRVKLMFYDNPHGADPVSTVEGVLTFPGRGHKGVVKPGQLWDCDVVFASHNYVMIAPRIELEDALDSELGVLRYHQGAREVAHLKLNDAMDLLRSGQIPAPVLTPRPLPKRPPPTVPKSASPPAPSLPPATKNATPKPAAPAPAPPSAPSAAMPASAIPPVPPAPRPPEPAPERPPQIQAEASVAAEVKSQPTSMPFAAAQTSAPPVASATGPAVPTPTLLQRSIAPSAPTAPRTLDEWRRLLDGPDGRLIAELLADRLGITAALPRIEDTIDGQEEILSVLRGEAGDIRKSIKDISAQVEDVRKQTLAWRRKENQDLRGVPKPVPKDPDHPTDEEIEAEIIHQLYQKDCWGNKYGQYEKLKRGYNSKASDRQVRAAVQRLQDKRWILIYAKDTDQFRLNPTRAEDIYRLLGVPDRAAEQLAEETRDEFAESAAVTKRDLEQALDGVASRTDVERLLTPIRQKLTSLEDRPVAPLPAPVTDTSPSRASELAEIKGLLRGLQGEINRLKKLAEDTASAQRRLEAQVKELAES